MVRWFFILNISYFNSSILVIDPGHGGSDTGAIGPDNTAEKDVTLTIARDSRKFAY